jgi:hypothetical protein
LEDDVELQPPDATKPGTPANTENAGVNSAGDAVPGSKSDAAAAAAAKVKMTHDYRAWIAARKAIWHAHRLERRTGGRGMGAAGGVASEPADLGALGQGMQRQMAAVMHATWQVLQVRL